MRYRNDETSPLRLNKSDVEEAIRHWLKAEGREEADRIKHISWDVDWDEHNGGFAGANVYLVETTEEEKWKNRVRKWAQTLDMNPEYDEVSAVRSEMFAALKDRE